MPRDVGLCWGGSPQFRGDRERSIYDLDVLRPLLAVPGVRWHSLMVGPRAAEAEMLGLPVPAWRTYADSARGIQHLDLVISTCTSVAHLAGGLGRPLWVLLEFHAEWRWGTHPTRSDWYPHARLFRQSAPGDWAGVIARVSGALIAETLMEAA